MRSTSPLIPPARTVRQVLACTSAVHQKGASLKQVSVWLGHADVQTTERYIRVFLTQSSGHEFLPR